MRKVFTTTFSPEFIELIKLEAIKRDMHVNELLEKVIKEWLEKEKNKQSE